MSLERTLSRLVRYGMTGGVAAVVDLGVFSALCPAFLPIAIAATISWIICTAVNYALSTHFVFNQVVEARGLARFYAAASVGLVLNVTVTVLVASLASVPAPAAKTVAIATAFLFNFWLNSVFVFGSRPSVIACTDESSSDDARAR